MSKNVEETDGSLGYACGLRLSPGGGDGGNNRGGGWGGEGWEGRGEWERGLWKLIDIILAQTYIVSTFSPSRNDCTLTSAEAQNRFGHLLRHGTRETVAITRHGRPRPPSS